jgi:predicted methyltransferase MtxX (methanogen marker protein 4)
VSVPEVLGAVHALGGFGAGVSSDSVRFVDTSQSSNNRQFGFDAQIKVKMLY